ncbi:LPXTG cell wall anchor domain-containing protein [Clostridium sp.]|uniref:LPXTG cell wall anchor domain-containing protein n=1 Tax=Clostridium sp. TaxID=1506 RepID=UPI001A55954C|nr:LPXTG cell wall anchor domain-containing protein [Clostridium sp.]MBK5243020.1 LPXTG cell wall anchor domain-containing protein [Clostridium sp.]
MLNNFKKVLSLLLTFSIVAYLLPATNVSAINIPPLFEDANLQAYMESWAGEEGSELSAADVVNCTESTLAIPWGVDSLGGLEVLNGNTTITDLIIRKGTLSDIAPLSNLKGLKSVDIGFTNIIDISSLTAWSSVEVVNFYGNGCGDISVMKGWENLIELNLSDDLVSDESLNSSLGALTNLRWLSHNGVLLIYQGQLVDYEVNEYVVKDGVPSFYDTENFNQVPTIPSTTITVHAPSLEGYTLTSPSSVVLSVNALNKVRLVNFEYETTVDYAIATHVVKDGVDSLYTTLEDLSAGDHTIQAPSLDGYVLTGDTSAVITLTKENNHPTVTFTYDTIPVEEAVEYSLTINTIKDDTTTLYKLREGLLSGSYTTEAPSIANYTLVGASSVVSNLTKINPGQILNFNYIPKVIEEPVLSTVEGYLRLADGTPLANVLMTLHSDPRTTLTNSDGYFKFSDVVHEKHVLSVPDDILVKYPGMSLAVTISGKVVASNGTSSLNFDLTSGGDATVIATLDDTEVTIPVVYPQTGSRDTTSVPISVGLLLIILSLVKLKKKKTIQ